MLLQDISKIIHLRKRNPCFQESCDCLNAVNTGSIGQILTNRVMFHAVCLKSFHEVHFSFLIRLQALFPSLVLFGLYVLLEDNSLLRSLQPEQNNLPFLKVKLSPGYCFTLSYGEMDFGANTEEPPFLLLFRPTGGFDWTDRFLARSEGVGDLPVTTQLYVKRLHL